MAKLAEMPSMEIIDGFKGVIDYYVWCGIPCARSWPRSPGHDRAPTVRAGWPAFTWASKNWNTLTPAVQDAYRAMASGTRQSGRDMFIKCYIKAPIIHE